MKQHYSAMLDSQAALLTPNLLLLVNHLNYHSVGVKRIRMDRGRANSACVNGHVGYLIASHDIPTNVNLRSR